MLSTALVNFKVCRVSSQFSKISGKWTFPERPLLQKILFSEPKFSTELKQVDGVRWGRFT